MNKAIAGAVLLLILGSVGIAGAAPARQSALPSGVVDVEWSLVSLRPSGEAAEDTTGLGLTLTLAGDGKIAGSGGCNRFFAGYTVGDGQALSFDPIAGTLIACDPPIAEREQRYFQALEAVSSYNVANGRLTLKSGASGELVYAAGGQPAQLPATGVESWNLWLVLAAVVGLAAGLVTRRHARPRPVYGE